MPIYEYICPRCRAKVEKLLTPSQRDSRRSPPCPHCGKAMKAQLPRFARTSLNWEGKKDE